MNEDTPGKSVAYDYELSFYTYMPQTPTVSPELAFTGDVKFTTDSAKKVTGAHVQLLLPDGSKPDCALAGEWDRPDYSGFTIFLSRSHVEVDIEACRLSLLTSGSRFSDPENKTIAGHAKFKLPGKDETLYLVMGIRE